MNKGRSKKPATKLPMANIELDVTGLTHEGKGVARLNGKTVFVNGALPGEVVQAQITKQKARYEEADLREIIQASEQRVNPECEYYGLCGGCSMQHLQPDSQIEYKQQHLLSVLERIASRKPETILNPVTGPVWNYRRKARLATYYDRKKKTLVTGFRQAQSKSVVAIEHCRILSEPFNHLLGSVSDAINGLENKAYVSHIDLIQADNANAILIRHVNNFSESDIEQLQEYANQKQLRIYLQGNEKNALDCITCEPYENTLQINVHGLGLKFLPDDFIQVNRDVNEKMLNQAIELLNLTAEDELLELFCGMGNFSLPIAKQVRKLAGVEVDASMVEQAKSNAQLNNINNATFFQFNLIENLNHCSWLKEYQFNKVLLDPPRSGALEQMLLLNKLLPEKILYISCDPATLARDIALINNKYSVKYAGVINMFPHTSHVESMVLLEKTYAGK